MYFIYRYKERRGEEGRGGERKEGREAKRKEGKKEKKKGK